ncbi:hypothetical protein [Paenibacillus sp. sgz5001063]|uniref:hypothetical protein n=1 Tax=Paenibacillus sp. sgz5001063 TaxID=3242474 RepID=UPI0036D2E58D
MHDSNLVDERKAALRSLAKGHDYLDIETGLKVNSLMQYINIKNGHSKDHCPLKDNDINPIPVDAAAVSAFIDRYESSTGYHREYVGALRTRRRAKNVLDMNDWLDTANRIRESHEHFKKVPSRRSKDELIETILTYRSDNRFFFKISSSMSSN